MKRLHEIEISNYIKSVVPKNIKPLMISSKTANTLDSRYPGTHKYIVLMDILESTKDISELLDKVNQSLSSDGKLIIFYKNFLYHFLAGFFTTLLHPSIPSQNWLSRLDLVNFLHLSDFSVIFQSPFLLFSVSNTTISKILNKFVLRIFPFNHLSSLHVIVVNKNNFAINDTSISLIVPAKNEEGNIEPLFEQLPVLTSKGQEIIFVVATSRDNTRSEIIRCIAKYRKLLPYSFRVVDQKTKGKAAAVWQGMDLAKNEILCILDSDLSVKPKELHKFYHALISGKGEFINGSRLVYPLETNAMQFLNIFGNKIFSLFYSFILNQSVKDTLCGTKMLWTNDYKLIRSMPNFGIHDPFGDFSLLVGAAQLNLKIIDLPIRYYARNYGTTNISRFKNGWQLFRYSFYATRKLFLR